jgi:iron complex outermembrane receptor protein/vitamin B12 transporter
MLIAPCRHGARSFARLSALFLILIPALLPTQLLAGIIRGTITDTTGATVTGATVVLLNNGNFVSKTVSTADGSYQFVTGQAGRFVVAITAQGFQQLNVPAFYATVGDSVERNLVLEPEWVHQSIVVTATGTPTPQEQTSSATSVFIPIDFGLSEDLGSVLRIQPGAQVMQAGQLGAQTSLFLRGGDSDANKILLDGVEAGDLGGRFDFGNLATTGLQSVEVYRGPDSDLYGADAGSGVVSLTTPHGISPQPTVHLNGDYGNFYTSHEEADLAGSWKKYDYYSAYSWLQTSNAISNDQFHVGTMSGNLGWQPIASTQVRGTVHYGVDATGIPNAYEFYHVTDEEKEGDQDLFISGSLDNQTTVDWHNSFRYGATRKREQVNQFANVGQFIVYDQAYDESAYFGNPVTITGANGYSVSGRAIIDYPGLTRAQFVSNRDQLVFTSDYHFTPHLTALVGFRYEDERGSEPDSAYYPAVDRRNSDYIANVHGDFKNRLFYTLGGSLEHYSLFGTQTSPRAGLSFYAVKPRKGIFNGTRILFNFGDAVREPALTDQDYSLYTFLNENGGQSTIQSLHIGPLAAPTTRTYEGGVEQLFLSEHIVFRASYFHNEFGKQIEYVGIDLIPELLPNLTSAQQQQLETILVDNYAYELTLNTEAFRAQGIEASVEGGIGHSIFLRGGYTYLDAVVQRSFANADTALLGPIPTYNGIPIGAISPLQGARPFRRAPHTGYVSASYSGRKVTAMATGAFSSRSDDSTYLEDEDLSGGNSLLLPNRNLDHGFAKLDMGLSYQFFPRLAIYGQGENLLSQQHIAPIGYPSLPMNFRVGLRLRVGKGSGE